VTDVSKKAIQAESTEVHRALTLTNSSVTFVGLSLNYSPVVYESDVTDNIIVGAAEAPKDPEISAR
jgi:hypothetical protein